MISSAELEVHVSLNDWATNNQTTPLLMVFGINGGDSIYDAQARPDHFVFDATGEANFLVGRSGAQNVGLTYAGFWLIQVAVNVGYALSDDAEAAWQMSVWQSLHDAAWDAFYSGIQALTQQRDALQAEIAATDTLTLRQEELEEVMKGVLHWLLGPAFDFMPPDVVKLFTPNATGQYGLTFTGADLGVDATGWATMFQYQEMVKFLHEAIEWENMLYFAYPYFWDVPAAWDFVRTLEHPDPTRQQFLRSGSARVVLTVAPGFEDSFAAFIDRGDFGEILPPDHPYVTIGKEIAAYANTNYPGIPPANPESDYRPLLTPLQRKAWQDMQSIISLLAQYHEANDAYPTTADSLAVLSQLGTIPSADPWGNPYVYRSPGAYNDYELSSLGADQAPGGEGDNADITSWASASLIGLWHEYTPTHGTDIQVNTAPADMA